MRHGVLLLRQSLGERALAAEHVGQEQRIVAEAVLAALGMPDAPLDDAAGDLFGAVLVYEHERAHEARRALRVGHVGELIEQLRVVGGVEARR